MKTVTFTGNKPQLTVWRSNNQKSPEQDDHPHALPYQPAPAATHEEPPVLCPDTLSTNYQGWPRQLHGAECAEESRELHREKQLFRFFHDFLSISYLKPVSIFSCVDFIKHITLQLSSEKSCPVHQIYENRSAEADFQWLCMSPSVPLKTRPTQDLAEDCSHVQLDVHAQCKATQCSSRSPV